MDYRARERRRSDGVKPLCGRAQRAFRDHTFGVYVAGRNRSRGADGQRSGGGQHIQPYSVETNGRHGSLSLSLCQSSHGLPVQSCMVSFHHTAVSLGLTAQPRAFSLALSLPLCAAFAPTTCPYPRHRNSHRPLRPSPPQRCSCSSRTECASTFCCRRSS